MEKVMSKSIRSAALAATAIGLASLLATSVAITGCEKVSGQQTPKQEPVRLVRVTKVGVGAPMLQLSFAGEVRARYETALSFRVGGKLVERSVEVGTIVQRGQPLARLDPKDLQLGMRAQQADLNAARSELRLAEADYHRFKELREKNFISQAEFDRRETALQSARQRVAATGAQTNQARNQAGYAALVAEHAGVVTAVSAEIGQVVAAGQPVVRVARLEEKEIVISVPESQVAQVKSAGSAAVTLLAQPGKTYTGALREFAPSSDPATRTFTAKIAVRDADEALRLGMTSQVVFAQRDALQVMMLPLSALYTKSDKPSVWIVDPRTSKVATVAVETSGINENQVMIKTGLKPGDVVVTAGANLLIPGQQVRFVESES
jgi:RND family efflux transporter MFP subunit